MKYPLALIMSVNLIASLAPWMSINDVRFLAAMGWFVAICFYMEYEGVRRRSFNRASE